MTTQNNPSETTNRSGIKLIPEVTKPCQHLNVVPWGFIVICKDCKKGIGL